MSALIKAMAEVRAEIKAGKDIALSLAEAAEEHGVPSALIRVKLEQSSGMSLEALAALPPLPGAASVLAAARAAQEARDKARREQAAREEAAIVDFFRRQPDWDSRALCALILKATGG